MASPLLDASRTLPSAPAAEQALLGGLLQDSRRFDQIAELVSAADFYHPEHRLIFEAIADLVTSGKPSDPITVAEWLRHRGLLEKAGGEDYLQALASETPPASDLRAYAELVRERAVLRALIQTGGEIADLAYRPEGRTVEELLDLAEQKVFQIADQRRKGTATRSLREVLRATLHSIEERYQRGTGITGIPTGFHDLDEKLAGLQRGDLILIAGRPSMGKCVVEGTRVVDPSTGRLEPIEQLVKRRQATLLSLNAKGRLVTARAEGFVDDGFKPVWRVRTALGREILATASHPFLTIEGWRRLEELRPGDHIAVPRRLPVSGKRALPEAEVRLIAYFLTDGTTVGSIPRWTNRSVRLQRDFLQALASRFPSVRTRLADSGGTRTPTLQVVRDRERIVSRRRWFARRLREALEASGWRQRTLAKAVGVTPDAVSLWLQGKTVPTQDRFSRLRLLFGWDESMEREIASARWNGSNPVTAWLRELGLWGKSAREKRVPACIFELPRHQLALFLNRAFACDGSVYVQNGDQAAISYATSSEGLARDMQHLLLRFGIVAKLRRRQVRYRDGRRPAFELRLTRQEDIETFAREIGIFGKEARLERALAISRRKRRKVNRDLLPPGIWKWIERAKGDRSWADLAEALGHPRRGFNLHVGRRRLSRPALEKIALALGDEALHNLATSDIYWDEIVEIEPAGIRRVYDLVVPEHHNFVAEDLIVHNTSFALNIAHHVALKEKLPVLLFSLEMPAEQIALRLLSQIGHIDQLALRTGRLADEDWPRLLSVFNQLAQARLFIDDTFQLTPTEMRAKARRLAREQGGLGLIVVDYLQLMHLGGEGDRRVEEIGRISRSLKMLAKELSVPVVALSQLNRNVEQRQDKRPVLSDLRESGCLTGDTLIPLAPSGRRVPLRTLIGQEGFWVWALDERSMKLRPAQVSRAFSTGRKRVYRLTTALGRTIRATANHPFLTLSGWKRLDQLALGERIALPRHLPTASQSTLRDEELALLGHLIGDGCTLPRHAIQYTTCEEELADIVADLASRLFGDRISPRIKRERNWFQVYLSARRVGRGRPNPVAVWLRNLGIFGLRSYEKFLPEELFSQSQEGIAIFLRHLWCTDGTLNPDKPACSYSTSSARLAADLQSLLLRLGINASLKRVQQKAGRDQFHVIVSGKPNLELFCRKIGAVGDKRQRTLKLIQERLQKTKTNPNRDVIPASIWRDVIHPKIAAKGWTGRAFQAALGQTYCGSTLYQANLSRERLLRVASVLDDEELARLATSDVYWDRIVALEEEGEEEVFDLTVPGFHNFVANDIVVHNSLEQDADVILFIYREEVYRRQEQKGQGGEAPEGIAEIIIGKQRNGPIGTVKLKFLAPYTSFENLEERLDDDDAAVPVG